MDGALVTIVGSEAYVGLGLGTVGALLLHALWQSRHEDVAKGTHIVGANPLPLFILRGQKDGFTVEDGEDGLDGDIRGWGIVMNTYDEGYVRLGDAKGHYNPDEGTHRSCQLVGYRVGEEPIEGQGKYDVDVVQGFKGSRVQRFNGAKVQKISDLSFIFQLLLVPLHETIVYFHDQPERLQDNKPAKGGRSEGKPDIYLRECAGAFQHKEGVLHL